MKNIIIEKNKSVYTIKLNRPEVRNAFNDDMISEMTEAFESLHSDPEVRVVILKGEGESFCAGGDLNWMKSMVDYTEAENVADSQKLFNMYQALEKIPCPVIGLVHGHSMGGGMGLVALCDIVAAVDETQFCFSEVRLGLAPAVISGFVAKKMSRMELQRYFLTAEVFDAEEAFTLGLLHFNGDQASVEEFVAQIARKISNNSPQAVRATKKLIDQIFTPGTNVEKETVELIAKLRVSEEGQEGLKAFFEKRKPSWIAK